MLTKEFIKAGRAVFTVSNPTGVRYTYRITHKEATDSHSEAYFVSLLTGPDNTSSYTYLGMLDPATGAVRLTRASRYNDNSLPVKVIRWFLAVVWGSGVLPEGYAAHHEGCCGRCGRALTVPESVESGISPECAKIMGIDRPEVTRLKHFEATVGWASEGASTAGLNAQYDREGDLTHWEGVRDGRSYLVYND